MQVELSLVEATEEAIVSALAPGSVARAPAPSVSRARAPPMCRIWRIVTVWPRPEPGLQLTATGN